MKQTISTVYPPPPNRTKTTTTTHAKNTTKIEWVSTWLLAGRQLPPTPPPPPSFFAMQHLKHLNGISLAGRWLLDIVYRVCPCLVPASSSFALIRFLRSEKNVYKLYNKTSHAMLLSLNHARIQKFCQTKSNTFF